MDIKRKEIMEGVFLNCLQSDKFKTSFMSLSMLSQLKRDTASLNAIIPFVLKRGSKNYPDMESLNQRLDELYGTAIEPLVRRVGEVQSVGFVASFPEDKYLPGTDAVSEDAIKLLAEILLNPAMERGAFIKEYVESEKENLEDLINSAINNKRAYSISRCIEQMCIYEDISVGKYGKAEDVLEIDYKDLTKHYKELLKTSPIEIFFFGQKDEKEVEKIISGALKNLPRGEIDYDIGTDIRLNSVEEEPRYFEENLDVTQGKLVLGFRLGECMDDPDIAAIDVFNAVFGCGVNSKLFLNVREKLHLCYYASSSCDFHKGIMLASSGIEFDKFDEAKSEILHQLDLVKKGEITDDELKYAKANIMSDLKGMSDSQYELESYYFGNTIDGLDYPYEELREDINNVTREDVINIAKSIELDLVYFMRDIKDDDKD